MNFTLYLSSFKHAITRIFVFAITLISLLSFTAYASKNSYQLTKVAQLEHQLISQTNWQQLIANPSNKKQYFVIEESGQVYIIDDGEIGSNAMLDMRITQQTSGSFFKLTAIELHPNFSLRDQLGYGTFYTAHIENSDKNSKTKRIQAQGDELSLSFDAVITEWQLNAVNYKKVDRQSKREVLRIGVPDNSMVIKQMSFSPYIKSWNDDFGLLYVSLNGGKKWPQPLYSGVILRIDPAKYGMHSFRVPTNNPYIKNSQVHNAIYLMGGQNIEQFIWPDKSNKHILFLHQYDNKYLLSLTDGKDDWRGSTINKQILYQSEDAIKDVMIYRGRQWTSLHSNLLLLRRKEQHWFIDSLTFNLSDNKALRGDKRPQVEWLISSEELPESSQIILNRNHDNEILLLEKATSALFRLKQQLLHKESVAVENDINNTNEGNSSNMSIYILLVVLTLLAIIFAILKRNSHSVKAIVRQQYASFELNESCQQILLFQRHQKNAETIINLDDLVSCEIKLNEQSIRVINDQPDYGFTHVKEESLRTIFANEKIDKMVDGKVRQITLLLTNNQKNSYAICLYMRKGSNRITKKSYTKVINELIDWCWFIGEKLNKDDTEKRIVKPKTLPKEKSVIQPTKEIDTPSHNKAEITQPLTSEVDNTTPNITSDKLSTRQVVANENNPTVETAIEKNSEIEEEINQDNMINTELVDALEKLVNLKQQGFLTMEEFSKAKETLLKNLLKK